MTYKIQRIEGVGPTHAERLVQARITTTDELLERCSTPEGRRGVAGRTELSESQILKWTNMADLMRVSGIGPEFAELLEASGVDTIRELKQRDATNLAKRMKEVNQERRLTRAVPSPKVVTHWIDAARSMEGKISY